MVVLLQDTVDILNMASNKLKEATLNINSKVDTMRLTTKADTTRDMVSDLLLDL